MPALVESRGYSDITALLRLSTRRIFRTRLCAGNSLAVNAAKLMTTGDGFGFCGLPSIRVVTSPNGIGARRQHKTNARAAGRIRTVAAATGAAILKSYLISSRS